MRPYDELIKVFDQEVEFYKKTDNDEWSAEKNKGFKEGLKYSRKLVKEINKLNLED